MSQSVGQVELDLKINGKDYKKQISKIALEGSKILENSFSQAFKNIGKVAIDAFNIKSIGDFMASCLSLGSALTDVQNVIDVTIPSMNGKINEFSDNITTQFGLSETAAKKYSGTFEEMAKAFKSTESAASEMTKGLSGLSGDALSSNFLNLGKNIVQAIANGFMSAVSLLQGIGENIIATITSPIIAHKDDIKTPISDMLASLEDITSKIAGPMANWDSFMKIFDTFAGVVSDVKNAFLLFQSSGILAFLSTSFGTLGTVLSTVWIYISTFFGGLSEGLGIMGSLQAVLPSSISSFSGLGTMLSGLLNPVTLIIGALALLALGFTYLYSTSETFRTMVNDMFSQIATHVGGIITGLITILTTLWTEGISPIINSTLTAIATLWDGGLSDFITNVSMFILNLINSIVSIWDYAINPLINLLLTIFLPMFTLVWDGILAIAVPIIEKILEYVNGFMEVLNILMAILNEHVLPIFKVVFDGIAEAVGLFWEFAKPIFGWFTELLGSVVSFVLDFFLAPIDRAFENIVQLIKDIAEPISTVFDGIKEIFQGIIDFVLGVFTGDWSRAWDGIKEIFSGVWNTLSGIVEIVWKTILNLFGNAGSIFSGVVEGIANTFKNIVNCIIDGINKVIAFPFEKINGLLNDIRKLSFLGITPFSFIPYNVLPVPQLPKLAQGGYVGANQPQLAMIGDNKRYGEIVAPENKMLEMINTALNMQKEKGLVNGIDTVIALIIQLIEAVKGLVVKVDIDMKKLSVLLESAKKERQMIGG